MLVRKLEPGSGWRELVRLEGVLRIGFSVLCLAPIRDGWFPYWGVCLMRMSNDRPMGDLDDGFDLVGCRPLLLRGLVVGNCPVLALEG